MAHRRVLLKAVPGYYEKSELPVIVSVAISNTSLPIEAFVEPLT